MTKSEYQELVNYLGPKFEKIDERFDEVDQQFKGVDRRFDKSEERLNKVEVLCEEARDQIRLVAENVSFHREATKRDLATMRVEMADEFNAVRAQSAAEFKAVRTEMARGL